MACVPALYALPCLSCSSVCSGCSVQGRPFAWQEAHIALASIVQKFDIVLDDPSYTLELKQMLTIKPKGFYVHAVPRRRAAAATAAAAAAAATAAYRRASSPASREVWTDEPSCERK